MYNIEEADNYVNAYVLDVDEWNDSDDDRKTRCMNVAARVLSRKYSKYTIPDNAIYEFAAVLANVFSDTYKMQRYGVASFSVKGISFTFTGKDDELERLITDEVKALIGEENGVTLTGSVRVGWSLR